MFTPFYLMARVHRRLVDVQTYAYLLNHLPQVSTKIAFVDLVGHIASITHVRKWLTSNQRTDETRFQALNSAPSGQQRDRVAKQVKESSCYGSVGSHLRVCVYFDEKSKKMSHTPWMAGVIYCRLMSVGELILRTKNRNAKQCRYTCCNFVRLQYRAQAAALNDALEQQARVYDHLGFRVDVVCPRARHQDDPPGHNVKLVYQILHAFRKWQMRSSH